MWRLTTTSAGCFCLAVALLQPIADAGTSLRVAPSLQPAASACGHRISMGVDYYPEHWPEEDLIADMTAIKLDLGANFIRIGEFMWHMLEPQDGVFDFKFLDRVIDAAENLGLEVMLGTPTATVPAWMYKAHPDIFAVGPDSAEGFSGQRPAFGGRQQRSFHSSAYKGYASRIVTQLAERYGKRSAVAFWQVDNELGNEQGDLDFSDNALLAWRIWLDDKYDGNVTHLNVAWGTVFWSVTYDDFDQIGLPRFTRPGGALQGEESFRSNQSPGMLLDFRRFMAQGITHFVNMQVGVLRNAGVVGCITSNSNGGYWGRAIDHNEIFAQMDFPSYDNYPVWGGSLKPDAPSKVAMMLDTVRGWTSSKDRTAGWMVAEQLIGAQGHDIMGWTPRPDQIVAWSAQTLLHGATSLAFFRYRAATFGQEMFCYGILDHATPRGKGRKWKETKKLYELARVHEKLWLGPVTAKVALLYSIDGIFSWNAQPQSTAFEFTDEAQRMYHGFWRNGAATDVVTMQRVLDSFPQADALLAQYSIILLPAPIMIPDGLVELLSSFVKLGGILWVGYRSDLKDSNNNMRRATSRLADLAGVEIEEIESLNAPLTRSIVEKTSGIKSNATVWTDGLRISEGSGASTLWSYSDDFFGSLGLSAMTQRETGSNGGVVVYMGTGLDAESLLPLATDHLQRQKVPHTGLSDNPMVEQLLRRDVDGKVWRVAIDHGGKTSNLDDGTELKPFAVNIRESVEQPQDPPRQLYQ